MHKSNGSPYIANSEDIKEWYILFYGDYNLYKVNGYYEEAKEKAMAKGKEIKKEGYEIYCYEELKGIIQSLNIVTI